jgi:spore coat polysaccharide biosynthesis protein SpsF (cytidylyltransferase family)
MSTVAMIVARTGSTRVPEKALLDIEGAPVIAHIIRIATHIKGVDSVCLATTTEAGDDRLAGVAKAAGIDVFRGDPERVLDRLHGAAVATGARTVVYVGGDCPLLDPSVISRAIDRFRDLSCDYLSNYDPPSFPNGLDVNVISSAALARAYEAALAPSQRVHAFSYLTFHPHEFRIANFDNDVDLSTHHWAIDDPGDIDFVRKVYHLLYPSRPTIHMGDVLDLLERDVDLRQSHRRLAKPSVAHAFLASPHMMKDILGDVVWLCSRADDALRAGDYGAARRFHAEAFWITKKLSQQ